MQPIARVFKTTIRVSLLALLCACSTDSLLPVGSIILGSAAIGGVGYLLSDRPELEVSRLEGIVRLNVGEVKAVHFQLRIPIKTEMHQQVRTSVTPADLAEVLDPAFFIDESLSGLTPRQGEESRITRYTNRGVPRLRGLRAGKGRLRIEALGTAREFDLEVTVPKPVAP